ncbi:hypothetical protein ACFRI7_20810 [Streptomyces sp. NPDC056716]|uniref:hypothetical protein n=1 Tax=unclassified Streptomyces TaxID=2593676 RepID=UPI0036775315
MSITPHPQARADLDLLPVNGVRRTRTAGLLDVVHDPSGAGAHAALPVVPELLP